MADTSLDSWIVMIQKAAHWIGQLPYRELMRNWIRSYWLFDLRPHIAPPLHGFDLLCSA